jgi:hypothetical protein
MGGSHDARDRLEGVAGEPLEVPDVVGGVQPATRGSFANVSSLKFRRTPCTAVISSSKHEQFAHCPDMPTKPPESPYRLTDSAVNPENRKIPHV